MIYVVLQGHDFKNHAEDVTRLFFPGEEIRIINTNPPEETRGIFLFSCVYNEETSYRIETEIKDPVSQRITREYRLTEGAAMDGSQDPLKTLRKEVKRQLYLLLSAYTGKKFPWGVLTGIRPAKIVHELLEDGFSKEQVMDTLKNFYLVSEEKTHLIFSVAMAEARILKTASPDKISLYIGIPFCPTRCVYCSFTSNPISKYTDKVRSYMDALKYEMKCVCDLIHTKNYHLQSIYIGGGTPTALDSDTLAELLEEIECRFRLDTLEEYTLEAGRPDSVDERKLKVIKNSRVDRISINPQTMNSDTLKRIGRGHTPEDIIEAFKLARSIGFRHINMDLIAGLPGESLEAFQHTLEQIRKLEPESLTVHTMAVKRASKLNEDRENYDLTEGLEVSAMVDMAYDYAAKMGMHPYYLYRQKNMLGNLENIGYCKPGFESIFNIQTMEEKQTILAVGAGGITKVVYHDEDRIERAFNVKSVEEYIARVQEMVERKKVLLNEQ